MSLCVDVLEALVIVKYEMRAPVFIAMMICVPQALTKFRKGRQPLASLQHAVWEFAVEEKGEMDWYHDPYDHTHIMEPDGGGCHSRRVPDNTYMCHPTDGTYIYKIPIINK